MRVDLQDLREVNVVYFTAACCYTQGQSTTNIENLLPLKRLKYCLAPARQIYKRLFRFAPIIKFVIFAFVYVHVYTIYMYMYMYMYMHIILKNMYNNIYMYMYLTP